MAFKSYARTSSFRPIIIPDTSERDLRQEERDMAQARRAFEFGQDNRQRVQNQLEENQRAEAEARDRNFELNDDFIKQNRAAAKRNFDTRIQRLEQQQSNAQELMKFATQLSGTFAQQFSDKMQAKRDAERDFAYGLYYKYGVTTEERAALDAGEAQINGMQAQLNPVIEDLKRRGATNAEIQKMRNLSGYAEYGAKKAMVEKAGGQFASFVLADRDKYTVGDREMTFAQAVAEGDEVAAQTILDQMRPRYINQTVPGMDPIFLDKYMFPKMRDWEQTQIGEVRRNAVAEAKANEKLERTRLIQGDLDNPDNVAGAQEFVNRFELAGRGNRGTAMTNQIETLVAAAEVQPQKATQLIKAILKTRIVKTNGQEGTFEELNPAQAARLKGALNDALKADNANQSARQRQEDLLVKRVGNGLLNDLLGKPKAEWERAIKQFESGQTFGEKRIAQMLQDKMPNGTFEAKRDDFWRSQWENNPFLSIEEINGARDASEKLKAEFRKKAFKITPEVKGYQKSAEKAIKYAVTEKAKGVSIVDGSPQDDSVQLALAAANREYASTFAAAMKTTGDPVKADELAKAAVYKFVNGLEWVTDAANNRNSYFKGYTFQDAAARAKQSGNSQGRLNEFKAQVDEQGVDALSTQELIPFNTLKKALYEFKRTGTLPNDAYRLQFLAEQSPKITIVDVINGQIEYWKGVKGGDTIEGLDSIEDAFPPPPSYEGDSVDLDKYQREIEESNYFTANINTSYKPNPTRSQIAQVSMGGDPQNLAEGVNYISQVFNVPRKGAEYLAANIQQESSWNGMRSWGQVAGDGTSRNGGLVSWASWRNDPARLGKIERYLGKSIEKATHGEQLEAMMNEMRTSYPDAYAVFMNPNSTDAELREASYRYWGYGHEGLRFSTYLQDARNVPVWRRDQNIDPDVLREYNKRNGN